MVVCLERGADLHVMLMPLPLTVSCFSKIQIGFTCLVPAHLGSPRKRAFKWMCVCVCVCCGTHELTGRGDDQVGRVVVRRDALGDPYAVSTSPPARRPPPWRDRRPRRRRRPRAPRRRRRRGPGQPGRRPTTVRVRPAAAQSARLPARALRPHGRVLAAGRRRPTVVPRDAHVSTAQKRRLRAAVDAAELARTHRWTRPEGQLFTLPVQLSSPDAGLNQSQLAVYQS